MSDEDDEEGDLNEDGEPEEVPAAAPLVAPGQAAALLQGPFPPAETVRLRELMQLYGPKAVVEIAAAMHRQIVT